MDQRKITLAVIVAALTVAPAGAAPLSAAQPDVEGLRTMVKLRDATALHRAAAAYEAVAPRVLPPELEALIVEHYADEVVRRPLLALIARKLDNYQRYPRYASRRLFDLLYADLKSGKDTLHYSIRIVANDVPNVEADLAALLPSLEAASANEIALFLGTRRHAPSVPALRALHQRIPLDKNSNQALEHATWALLQIGTPDAVQAVLERLTNAGARTIATTHHGTLKAFAHATDGVENGSMEFDQATLSQQGLTGDHGADGPTPVILLIGDGIEIDGAHVIETAA